MSNIVNKKLSIDKNNIEQYCDAQNISFNVSDHAWRKWLNGSTDGYVILKSEGKAVLYPTDTARPFKADSLISASRSAGTCTVDLQFGGVQVHNESYTSGTQKQKSKTDITDSAVTNSTKATEIKWHVYGKNGDNQRGDLIELTLYFNQYSAQALIGNGANGVQSVSVSNFAPYYGDTITFGVKLGQGATFDGWYSDSACTQLVSTDTTYSIAPTADVTLYAKATTDATLYNVSAVAGSEITGVSVSDSIVPEGGTATFTAQANTGCSFEAWYSDDTYTTVVSTENPYTATITADTTLYAKAAKVTYSIGVGTAEHCTASVSATTAQYGDEITFSCVVDEGYEFKGWYSDSGLTQLVSNQTSYSYIVTSDITLYPKIEIIIYTVSLTWSLIQNFARKIISYSPNSLTANEQKYLKTGEFEKIDSAKIYDSDSATPGAYLNTKTISVSCPVTYSVSIYIECNFAYVIYIRQNNVALTNWPYLTITPTQNETYQAASKGGRCNCNAIAGNGIEDVDVTTPVVQGTNAQFTAFIKTGYKFNGWYSDSEYQQLISINNPASITTPINPDTDGGFENIPIENSYTLYAKAESTTTSTTGISLKRNSSWMEAKSVYRKVDGTWVQQDAPKTLFSGSSTGSEPNYIYCGDVSS